MRGLVIPVVVSVVLLLLAPTVPVADASFHRERVHLHPSSGSPSAVFTLTFRAPERTGSRGALERHDEITASASTHPGSTGCIQSIDVRAPDAPAGARVRVSLDPARLGGEWCPGGYDGRVQEVHRTACPPGERCPLRFVRHLIGRFTLRIRQALTPGGGSNRTSPRPSPPGSPPPGSATDRTPPTFSGLQSAFACTAGAQHPGQTTPYTLSWQAATDDVTPSSEIVYDVFTASTPGGEDFAHPTWTTPPGAASYRTPGLPSHGTYYFVVRARDQAGNEDQNNVERRGEDPCY